MRAPAARARCCARWRVPLMAFLPPLYPPAHLPSSPCLYTSPPSYRAPSPSPCFRAFSPRDSHAWRARMSMPAHTYHHAACPSLCLRCLPAAVSLCLRLLFSWLGVTICSWPWPLPVDRDNMSVVTLTDLHILCLTQMPGGLSTLCSVCSCSCSFQEGHSHIT